MSDPGQPHVLTRDLQARFALSEDMRFERTGKLTRIPWAADYNAYLQYLTIGWEERRQSVVTIIDTWNSTIYGDRNGDSGAHRRQNRGRDWSAKETDAVMAMLGADVVMNDDGDAAQSVLGNEASSRPSAAPSPPQPSHTRLRALSPFSGDEHRLDIEQDDSDDDQPLARARARASSRAQVLSDDDDDTAQEPVHLDTNRVARRCAISSSVEAVLMFRQHDDELAQLPGHTGHHHTRARSRHAADKCSTYRTTSSSPTAGVRRRH